MKKYEVLCLLSAYHVLADNWSVGHEGLKFYQGDEIVAWFTTWDYWMLKNES